MRLKTLALLAAFLLLLPVATFAATENVTHKTVVGEVLSFDGESLTVAADNGSYYFTIESETIYPKELSAGDLVAVDFSMGTDRDGVFPAQTVRVEDAADVMVDRDVDVAEVEVSEPETTVVTEIPEPRPTLPLQPAPRPDVDIDTPDTVTADFDADADVDLDADVPEVETTVRESLPATGSSLPLLGLGGVLALLGAGALRFFS